MTQEEKINDLEQRIALILASDKELCKELTHWEKVAAGSKGRNKQLAEENKALKEEILRKAKEIERQKDALSTAQESIANYKSELYETKIKLTDYKAFIEWYNELPWWKKIFVKRIETY